MSKKSKYIAGALFLCAIIMFVLYFVVGSKKEYTIIFDSTGGSLVASQRVVENNKVSKPANPTKENYNFIRWDYQNKEYDFNNKVTSDITLKAIWEEIVIEETYYDIEFVVNGVTKKLSLSKITEADIESLGFEEKDGYEIKWYVNDQEYDFNEPLTGNLSIVGKYEKITIYTVKFNTDGVGTVNSQKVKPNELAAEPEAITKHGYIFDGWYLNNNKYDFSTPVTKNITLVAKWTEDLSIKRYEVTFDTDGAGTISKQRVIENELATEPKTPTKTGYKFLGWYLDDKSYDFKTKVTSNITLKAKWEKIIQYTVTFKKDNGTADETKLVNSGEKVSKPTDPIKDGYKFANWLYQNEPFDFKTPITEDITLTAYYTALPKFIVTFDTAGGSTVPSQTVYEGGKVQKPANPTRDDYDFDGWTLNGNNYTFNEIVTKDITLKAKWKAVTYNYEMIATHPDNFSHSEYELKLKRNGNEIEFLSIVYNGIEYFDKTLSESSLNDILNGLSTLHVKLKNGNVVTATIKYE